VWLGLSGAASGQTSGVDGKQLYTVHCLTCHGADGDSIPGVDMRRGQFKRASSDEDLSRVILSGVQGTAMPPSNLAEASRVALVAYIRSLHDASVSANDSAASKRGRALFEGKGGCADCHRIAGKGSRKGPDLTEVGVFKDAATLQHSIVTPGDAMQPQYRYVKAVTRDGRTVVGMRLNEDTHSVQLIDQNERLISLAKSDLREYSLIQTSPMPSYKDKLTTEEIADVVTYLLSVKNAQ
jgi:cytochrome c oxidase cbb3-type subunit III